MLPVRVYKMIILPLLSECEMRNMNTGVKILSLRRTEEENAFFRPWVALVVMK
jgi:hypothetical protein